MSAWLAARENQWHLLHPQLLQILHPSSNTRGSPHSGQYILSLSISVDTAFGFGTFFTFFTGFSDSLFYFAASSSCISLYISMSALPTAKGQQAPLLVSFLGTLLAV